MKILGLVVALMLSGCAGLTTLTPDTTVDPQLTDATNIGLCLLRAANGDCAAPCPAPTASATACAYMPATATATQDKQAIPACAGAIVATRATAYAQAAQIVLCNKVNALGATPGLPAALQPVVPIPAVTKP